MRVIFLGHSHLNAYMLQCALLARVRVVPIPRSVYQCIRDVEELHCYNHCRSVRWLHGSAHLSMYFIGGRLSRKFYFKAKEEDSDSEERTKMPRNNDYEGTV